MLLSKETMIYPFLIENSKSKAKDNHMTDAFVRIFSVHIYFILVLNIRCVFVHVLPFTLNFLPTEKRTRVSITHSINL